MNWPEKYRLIGDNLICKIQKFEEPQGITLLNRDPRKQDRLPDCYAGVVTEVGERCKLVKVGDEITFTRWQYSQSDVDDDRISLRECDLVIVNGGCVNGYIAVKLYAPFEKTEKLIQVDGRREAPKNYWGQIINVDHSSKNLETKNLNVNDIILFQRMDEYQYRIGKHTLVFKNDYDVVIAQMEEARELSVV